MSPFERLGADTVWEGKIVRVDFSVTGVNPTSSFSSTNANGVAVMRPVKDED